MTMRSAVADDDLQWRVRPAPRRTFELQGGGGVVATLRWAKATGSLALAESLDGRWTFKRAGFVSPRVTVRPAGADEDLAIFRPSWEGHGALQFDGERRFRWSPTGFWQSEWAFGHEGGDPLVVFSPVNGTLGTEGRVRIARATPALPELSILTTLGWYLLVLMEDDRAAIASVARLAATG